MTAPATSPTPDKTKTGVFSARRAEIKEKTLRTDRWWIQPVVTFTILSIFVVYTSVRIFMRDWYFVEDYHYLTPVFSPCISESCVPGSSDLGTWLPKLPVFIPLAVIVFPILACFRFTCYYYRKAYYRAFWQSPPGCGVAEPHKKYTGESKFPLIIQNLHRYFFFAAFLLLLVNTFDAGKAFFPAEGNFRIGVGTLVMVINAVMLWLYTLSCHACRHAVGGRLKHFSKNPLRYKMWTGVSKLNPYHMHFAWMSLSTVMLTDFYIMAVAAGWITDFGLSF